MNENIATAAKLAPILERVHGTNHPELSRVRELTEQLAEATSADMITGIFDQMRDATINYAVPSDGCEAYVSTYEALAAADSAHSQS